MSEPDDVVVNDFLQKIKSMGEQRDQDTEQRSRQLEEEILKGRKERQARRAERARSISPTKSSPVISPTTVKPTEAETEAESAATIQSLSPAETVEREFAQDNAMDRLTALSPTKENSDPYENGRRASETELKRNSGMKAPLSGTIPPRSPLSWQRRPNSQASDRPRSRPLSMVATENASRSPRATPEPASATEPTFSRDQIAQNLASKDPAWFRQTADRGLNSPAFRKNQVEDEDRSDHGSATSRVQMPGMLRRGSAAPETAEELPERTSSPSRGSTASRASYQASSTITGSLGSPMPMTAAQKFDPPTDSESERRPMPMSPSQGRISPERSDRPPSPTKGMGGFVQSAMMKRSDSVNKRWSVQSPPGLNRADSVASNRNSVNIGSSQSFGAPLQEFRPSASTRDSSSRPSSRPLSRHDNATVTQDRPKTANSTKTGIVTSTTNEAPIKPITLSSRPQTPVDIKAAQSETSIGEPVRTETPPPSSPTRALDSRRWSPTKSSWLESALNKPESPKPKAVVPPQQPSWMSEISKAKHKASVDLGRAPIPTSKHEVNIGGLMRSPPLGGHNKTSSISGLPAGFSSVPFSRSRTGSVVSPTGELSGGSLVSPISTGTSAPAIKTKPDTPPKKDLRASLKARKPASETSTANEPEFKNAFGQLKRTKTQNWVAPDPLKDNITRGKLALNLTGGPKATERKDEFKDAILKKKDDFQKAQHEGRGVSRSSSVTSQDAPIPEALARRRTLVRSESISTGSGLSNVKTALTLPIEAEPPRKPSLTKETSLPARLQAKEPVANKLAGRLNPAFLASLLARGPPAAPGETSTGSGPSSSVTATSASETTDPGPQLTHMTKGRARGPRRKAPTTTPVVATTSPSLSSDVTGKIVRSPRDEIVEQVVETQPESVVKKSPFVKKSPVQESGATSTIKTITQNLPIQKDTENETPPPSSPRKLDLKRRSQFLQDIPGNTTKVEPQLASPKPLSPVKRIDSTETPESLAFPKPLSPIKRVNSIETPTNVSSPKPLSDVTRTDTIETPKSPALRSQTSNSSLSKTKPSTPVKSPSLSSESVERFDTPSPKSPSITHNASRSHPSPLSPKPADLVSLKQSPLVARSGASIPSPSTKSMSIGKKDVDSKKEPVSEAPKQVAPEPVPISTGSTSVKNVASMWNRPSATGNETPPRARSPIKLPTQADENAALVGAGLRPVSPVKEVTARFRLKSTTAARPLPTPPTRNFVSPPPKDTASRPPRNIVSPPPRNIVSPPPRNIASPPLSAGLLSPKSNASNVLSEFFITQGVSKDFKADAATLLSMRPAQGENIKTLRSALYQMSNDGKKQIVPQHQERILFEGNVYLCTHTYGNAAGKKVTETYFWQGDDVPKNIVKQLESFAQKEAKVAGGKLVTITQGKETPEFFHALGGIIIIRRGSSNKYDSLAPHILCCRNYYGQIVFDEVDFSPASLCSGFPYLISTLSGKSYLWKGKGSGIDELSCARLIGMDFGLMGEVEEIDDGSEPAAFLKVFDDTTIPKSADHWRMKPNYSKYSTRLFRADANTKEQIVELSPFCQSDLDWSKIFVLDAFFEIYIIVGSTSQEDYASFQHALLFAQEYGILAAGMEDRPFVPVTTVVLEGVPKDMRSVFRKWTPELSPTTHQAVPAGNLRRGRSLRVLPLNAALDATRG